MLEFGKSIMEKPDYFPVHMFQISTDLFYMHESLVLNSLLNEPSAMPETSPQLPMFKKFLYGSLPTHTLYASAAKGFADFSPCSQIASSFLPSNSNTKGSYG